jgi:hypothetical protein
LGDKEHPDVYAIYNEGPGACVVDLVEVGMGEGGHDYCQEHKVWSELYKHGRTPLCPDCTLDGATHAFGNTEASALRSNFGVAARIVACTVARRPALGPVRRRVRANDSCTADRPMYRY